MARWANLLLPCPKAASTLMVISESGRASCSFLIYTHLPRYDALALSAFSAIALVPDQVLESATGKEGYVTHHSVTNLMLTPKYSNPSLNDTIHGLEYILQKLESVAATHSSKHDLSDLCQYFNDSILEAVRVDKNAFRAFFCSTMPGMDRAQRGGCTASIPAVTSVSQVFPLSTTAAAYANPATTSTSPICTTFFGAKDPTPAETLHTSDTHSFLPWASPDLEKDILHAAFILTPVTLMPYSPATTDKLTSPASLAKREVARSPDQAYRLPYYYSARPYYGPRVHVLPYGW